MCACASATLVQPIIYHAFTYSPCIPVIPSHYSHCRKKACTNLPGCKGNKRKDKGEPYCKKKSCNLTLRTSHLPAAEDDLSIYWRLARPELVRKWKALGMDPVS